MVDTSPAVSVIMPVYNSEAYVADAILSILVQDFRDFELLLVDDGSTDSSGELCDRFAERDPRIRVVHQANAGMCAARNVGISQARGTFLTFCDNDDLYLPDLLSGAMGGAGAANDVDCVCYGRARLLLTDGDRLVSVDVSGPSARALLPGDTLEAARAWHFPAGGVWCKLYRTEMLRAHGIGFDERLHSGYEDLNFNLAVFPHARRIAFLPDALYLWQQRQSHSTSLAFNENMALAVELAFNGQYELLKGLGMEREDPAAFKAAMLSFFGLVTGMLTYGRPLPPAEVHEVYRFLVRLYRPHLEEFRKLPGSVATMGALEAASHGLWGVVHAAVGVAAPIGHARTLRAWKASGRRMGSNG